MVGEDQWHEEEEVKEEEDEEVEKGRRKGEGKEGRGGRREVVPLKKDGMWRGASFPFIYQTQFPKFRCYITLNCYNCYIDPIHKESLISN